MRDHREVILLPRIKFFLLLSLAVCYYTVLLNNVLCELADVVWNVDAFSDTSVQRVIIILDRRQIEVVE